MPSLRLHLFEGSAEAPGQFQVPMLLLALLISDSAAATGWFREVLDRLDGDDGVAEAVDGGGQTGYPGITGKVGKVLSGRHFPLDKRLLAEWIPHVRRFSFDMLHCC